MQESQIMFGLNGPAILGFGFAIAIILIMIGFREKDDFFKKLRYMRSGGILFGLMIIITGLVVYGYLVATMALIFAFQDVLILSLVSSVGGLIIGIAIYYPIDQ